MMTVRGQSGRGTAGFSRVAGRVQGGVQKATRPSETRIRGHSSQVLTMRQMHKTICRAYLLYVAKKIVSEGGLEPPRPLIGH